MRRSNPIDGLVPARTILFTVMFLVSGRTTWCEEPLVTEDFESAALAWDPLGQAARTAVVDAVDAHGDPTRALRIRSGAGTTQGVRRHVEVQEIYKVQAEVYIEADMERGYTNVPIDLGFGVFEPSRRPFDWQVGSVYADGDERLEWSAFSTDPGENLISRLPVGLRKWYRVSLELDTSNGRLTSRVVELPSERELAFGTFFYRGVLSAAYDTVYIGAHQMAGGPATSSVLVDNVVYSPEDHPVPRAVLTVDQEAGIAPLTVNLAAASSDDIVLYEWSLGDGDKTTGEQVEHTFSQPGVYTIELHVENADGLCDTTRKVVSVRPNVDAAPPGWACDSFDSYDLGELPSTWKDLGTVVGDSLGLSTVVDASLVPGAASRALEIRSAVGTGQGVYRRIDPAEVYRVEMDLQIVQGVLASDRNIPIDLGFAIFDDQEQPYFWKIATVYAHGAESLVWKANASPSPQGWADWSVVGDARVGARYHVSLEVDTTLGLHTVQVWNLATDRESDYGSFTHEGVIGAPYDAVYIATYHLSGDIDAQGTSTIRIDNVCYTPGEAVQPPGFRRGDCNTDGTVDIADPVANLFYQFPGTYQPPCLDACDFDDNGQVEITDPIASLVHQFVGGTPPKAPGKERCGVDSTEDELGCKAFGGCGDGR